MKDIQDVTKLKDQLAPIVLQLKVHYNRPRPRNLQMQCHSIERFHLQYIHLKTSRDTSISFWTCN